MSTSNPLVSVIIPTYNHAVYLPEAIDSVLAQDYDNIEVIVVDDGSTDETRVIASQYGNKIKYLYQENAGLSAARNKGITNSQGEWIALLDADDTWHPQKTTLQLGAIKSAADEFQLLGSPPNTRALDAQINPDSVTLDKLTCRDFLIKTPFAPSSAMIRKAIFSEIGLFDTALPAVEDRDMWLRIASRHPAVLVNCRCWKYRLHDAQMSKSAEKMYKSYAQVLEKFFEANPTMETLKREALAYLQLDAATSFYDAGERLRAIKHLIGSTVSAPWITMRKRPLLRTKLLVKFLLRRPQS